MPYFTKKGSGKDKNKVCVYKKSDKKKVGCTAGPIEKYLTALRMAESGDFDFINDTDSLNGVRFTIGLSTIPNIIYTIEDDGQDHRVTVSWNEKEHLLIDRDENYDSIKWIINTNIRRKGDTLRLFNKYFEEDEFDSSDEEKRERVIDYMINNFEDEDILHYMGSELSDGKVSYNRDVVKRFFDEGDWKIYDKSLNESNDWGWISDVPGTKEFDQKYRYFEIVACYGIDYESEECDDEYSHYVRIPKHDADDIWDRPPISSVEMDYLAGPGDEGLGVIKYSIKNNLISRYEVLEIIMFEGVRELEEHVYEELTGYRESVNESKDFKWVEDSKPNWRTYYEVILDDVQKLPKKLEDVTDEMLLLIWMKIHTINKEIRKKSDDYPSALYSDKGGETFESIIQVEWLFGKIMALVAGKVDTAIKPQDYYEARKINIITNIKGILSQLELIGESNDLGWIEDVGQNRTYVLDKLKKFFNKKGIDVDWEHDYDENQTSHGDTEVYFGRFWFDGDDNNEYFIELYESDGGKMFFDLYVYDKRQDQYYRDAGYGDEARLNPTKPEDFWRLVSWLVLVKKGMHRSPNATSMNESDDFDWIEDVSPRMDSTLLKPGQKFYDKWGDVIRVLEYLGRDDEGEVCYEPPCSLLRFRKIKDPSGYIPIPGLPADDPQNTDMVMNPNDFDSYIESGKLKLVSKRTMYESKDFEWAKDVASDYYPPDLESGLKDLERWVGQAYQTDDEIGLSVQDVKENPNKENIQNLIDNLKKWKPYEDGDEVYWAVEDLISSINPRKFEYINKLGNDFVSESEDLDWIKNVKAQGFEKSKSYVVDVSDLMIDTPMSVSPTSEEYTKLTRADVLDKFKELGYNVDDISIADADYLYIEPNDEAGYWDDVVWVKQTHWLDYDMKYNTPDPTYGGKYEIIDVNNLMFLLDNKMVSESNDFEWIEDVPLTMNVCDAYYALNPGDEIIIDEISNWEDSPYRWDGEDEIQTFYNVKAKVLALDECNNIHKTNTSNDNTILVSIDEDGYYGFDEIWSREFAGDLPSKCRNNNCIFLICDDDEQDYEIRLVEKNKKPINEVAGISFESREWAKIINDEILKNPNEKERLIIDGYDYPEAFKSFPIDYVVIDFYDKLTGYGQEHSGYDKDGNYVVLLYIQPNIVSGVGGYNLRTVLNHEMKHAWDDYNRLSKGQPSIDKNKENRELYNKDFILMLSDKNVRGPIKELLKYYYYLSELEKTAYLENVYDGNLNYEKVIRGISSKDFESFKDRFDLDINWHLMNTAYDIPFLKKFKSPIEFIDYSSEELRSRAIDMIKKINKMKYVHGID